MFTVTVKSPQGDEDVFECVQVKRIAVADKELDRAPGVVLEFPDGSGAHYGFEDGNKPRYERTEIFVMNRFGATVARYPL
jgi:hypothetical protein